VRETSQTLVPSFCWPAARGAGLDPATTKGYSVDSGLWKEIADQKSGWIAPHRLRYAASFKWLFSRQRDKEIAEARWAEFDLDQSHFEQPTSSAF
jgi:hypothetical protein